MVLQILLDYLLCHLAHSGIKIFSRKKCLPPEFLPQMRKYFKYVVRYAVFYPPWFYDITGRQLNSLVRMNLADQVLYSRLNLRRIQCARIS